MMESNQLRFLSRFWLLTGFLSRPSLPSPTTHKVDSLLEVVTLGWKHRKIRSGVKLVTHVVRFRNPYILGRCDL